ncbi:DUF4240 domain-containing protein [Flavobacteriaceae bacterium Ap0902]|nr:DUF4240 domain-containing protein [Flavobacteriaceae bacterium Ap0902]
MNTQTEDKTFFWNAIEETNAHKDAHWSEYDIDEHIEKLTQYLSTYDKDTLIKFEKTLQEKLQELYTAEIVELNIILENQFTKGGDAYIFDETMSEDGFLYFRCWLLLKGKDFFDDIMMDIQNFVNGKYSFDIGDVWAEGLLYVTDDAYSANHENEHESEIRDAVYELHPEINYDAGETVIKRKLYTGGELQEAYPALVREILGLKNEGSE